MKLIAFIVGMAETTAASLYLLPRAELTPQMVVLVILSIIVISLCGGLALMGVWTGILEKIKKKEHDRLERLNGGW